MPELCRFLGIAIFMNYNDHNPPHFHAKYGDYEITIEINSERLFKFSSFGILSSSTPSGLRSYVSHFPWVTPTVIHIKPFQGIKHI